MKNIWDAAYGAYFAACVHHERDVVGRKLTDASLDAIAEDASWYALEAVARAKAQRRASLRIFKKSK